MSNGAVAKTTWTEADFDGMSWHDVKIHAVAVEELPDNPGRLLLDLDYIVEGVLPEPPASISTERRRVNRGPIRVRAASARVAQRTPKS
jgi:hypothetical protein